MKNRKLRFAAVVVALLFMMSFLILYLERNTMIVIAHLGGEDVYDEHSYQILNPFRDRQIEYKAERFFLGFQTNCKEALAALSDDAVHSNYTCEREANHPLINWHLRARRAVSSSIMMLRYQVSRYESKSSSRQIKGPFWIRLEKDSGRGWHVANYETWY